MSAFLASTWLPAFAVLSAAVCVAAAYLKFASSKQSGTSTESNDPNPERLQRRVERLMEQLRELEADQHLFTPVELGRQREQLELEAAAALKARDTYTPWKPVGVLPSSAPTKIGFLAEHPQLKGAFWGAGVVLFFVGLGWWLSQDNRPREEGPVTGQTPPMASPSPTARADAELEALRDHLEKSPDDVVAGARAAHLLLRRQAFDEAAELTERDLMLDPFHAETRIHAALLDAAHGRSAAAEKELARLAGTYPRAHEALMYLGMLRLSRGDKAGALEAFEHFVQEAPPSEQPPMLTSTLASLRAEVRGSTP